MELTMSSSVREVLLEHPGTRAVFEQFGLAGCGGSTGPDEAIAVFARAHEVDPKALLGALRQAAGRATTAKPAPAAQAEPEEYRAFLRAAVLIGAVAGAALGAVNLTWIATWGFTGMMPTWSWWPALVQAHGNAQLYGWCGLFIMGIAGHSLPRMLQRPPLPRSMLRTLFGLVLGGVLLGLATQPLADQPLPGRLFCLAMALQWAGVLLYTGWVLKCIGRPAEPHLAFISAGTLWLAFGATVRLALAVQMVRAGAVIPEAALNAAYLHAMSWGFLLSYVLGYSMRLLPAFVGLPPARRAPAWGAVGCVAAGGIAEVAARAAGLPLLSAAAVTLSAVGAALAIGALQLWRPPLDAADHGSVWLARFARTAYAWLVVAAILLVGLRIAEARAPLSLLHQHAFGGAMRHALTVGFVSLMLVGVAWRILPIFSGAQRPHPALLPTVYGLLLAGCALRVTGQIASGLWGGVWYLPMGLSGWLETAAIILFARDVLRLLQGTPADAQLPDPGGPVELSLSAPVGPLVAQRPWLVPVFAQHGMGQVSNPVFQRTVGQRVTVAQACGRFQVEPETFLKALREADQR